MKFPKVFYLLMLFLSLTLKAGIDLKLFKNCFAPKREDLIALIGEDLYELLTEARVKLPHFDKTDEGYEADLSSLYTLSAISVESNRIIQLIPKVKVKKNKLIFEISCPNTDTCHNLMMQIKTKTLNSSNKSLEFEMSDNKLGLAINRNQIIGVDVVNNMLKPSNLDEDYFLKLYQSGRKSIDVQGHTESEVSSLLKKGTSYTEPTEAYTYEIPQGFGGAREVNVPAGSRKVILKITSPKTLVNQYGYVVSKTGSNKYLLAVYNGNEIKFVEKELSEVEDIYNRRNDYSEKLFQIFLTSQKINHGNSSHPRQGLKLLHEESPPGSENGIKMFQHRAGYVEHKYPEFSPNMYYGLLNLDSGLGHQQLKAEIIKIRKKALNKERRERGTAGQSAIGVPRNGTTDYSDTRMGAYVDANERTEMLLKRKDVQFEEVSMVINHDKVDFKRLKQDGIVLTGYDTKNSYWIHTTGDNIDKGLVKIDQIFEDIIEKEYKDIDSLLSDLAEYHWWSAHVMPFERGSASIIDMISKYILMEKGYHPSRWKEGIIPDVEAFHTPLEEYKKNYLKFYER